jgi:two-component system response regulator RegA
MVENMLVIEDDPAFNAVLLRALRRRGISAHGVSGAEQAIALAKTLKPKRIVLDLNINGVSGLTLIPPLLTAAPGSRIVVLTGYASIPTTVDAIKLGATHYLAKPVDVDTLLAAFGSFAHGDVVEPSPHIEAVPLSVSELEWEHLQRVLHEHDGNISATARALKMHRRTLQRKLMRRSSDA